MMGWFYFSMPTEEELRQQRIEQQIQDSLAQVQQRNENIEDTNAARNDQESRTEQRLDVDNEEKERRKAPTGIFTDAVVNDTSEIVVETPLYTAVFTNIGGGPKKIILKDYETWDHKPVQMISDTTRSAYNIGFLSERNLNIETRNLAFEPVTGGSYIKVNPGQAEEIAYQLKVNDNKRLIITYRFFADTYEMDVDVHFEGLVEDIAGNNFDFGWEPGLRTTEKDHTIEGTATSAFVYAGGELERYNLDEAGTDGSTINGRIDWVATRTKFFTQIIKTSAATDAAIWEGRVNGNIDKQSTLHEYSVSMRTDIPGSNVASYQMYVGPLSWKNIKKYEPSAYNMVDLGWSWMRWFAEPLVLYVIIPFLNFVGGWAGNYGIAIILFAIAIKIVLFPLTKKSFESMAAMKELQPEMKAIQEKYKDNPQKQQQATMKLYKEAKVNPLGGCLPNLLQFPILITLWSFFQSSIEIRQKAFLWASDLSAPDVILNLPFSVPFLGDHLAGFVLIMSGTMIAQTQLTGSATGTPTGGAGGMNMKAFQYLLPVMLLFFFNSFASGLSLYYLIYNIMSIGQQLMINKNMDHDKMMSKIGKKKSGRKKGK